MNMFATMNKSFKKSDRNIEYMYDAIYIREDNTDISKFINDVAHFEDGEKSFLVCDLGKIIDKYNEWVTALPNITAYYAVKCNETMRVLETLAALGLGFDCASKSEIEKVLSIGVKPKRIIYANATKSVPYIKYAKVVGVSKMTFDNEAELYKIKEFHPNAELLLRFRCDDKNAQCSLGSKFGCDPILDAPELLKTARELNLNVIGVCFHLGTGIKNPSIFLSALNYARTIFDLAKRFNYNFSLLDIGGGFPGISGTSIDIFAEIIQSGLKKYFPDPNVTVIAEPGRFFVQSSCTLVANIHSVRPIAKRNGLKTNQSNLYYLNDGFYGSFGILLSHKIKEFTVEPLKKYKESKLSRSILWGPTCCIDLILDDVMLPQMNVGDWLIFNNMGAYTVSSPGSFNGFKPPNIYVVVNESTCVALKDTNVFRDNDFLNSQIILRK